MARKYVAKPLEIEAVQWRENNLRELIDFVGDARVINGFGKVLCVPDRQNEFTLEKYDYVVKDPYGYFRSESQEMFEQAYEEKK